MATRKPRIIDNTPAVLSKIRKLTDDGKFEFAQKARDIIKEQAPRDTGNHASNVEIDEPKPGTFRLFSSAGYGAYLEFGTVHMEARPHFGPGIHMAISEFQSEGKWGE